jgi:hypothetical protein
VLPVEDLAQVVFEVDEGVQAVHEAVGEAAHAEELEFCGVLHLGELGGTLSDFVLEHA